MVLKIIEFSEAEIKAHAERAEKVEIEATCKVCLDDFEVRSMAEDIAGAKYCYVCADICASCGVYQHNCEGIDLDALYSNWEITQVVDQWRYQATPIGKIIGFFGYADSEAEARTRLEEKADL